MSYILAIDVGTSFTAAAIARTDRIAPPVPESLPLGLRGTAVPSVVYYPEEGPILVGEAAERRGLDSPDRVVREFKRRIGDNVPIAVGTLSLPAEEVFATMAGWVVDRAAEREGEPPSQIILSHPAAWGGHRTAVIQEALAARGLHGATLISEPEAAALHYASQVRVEDGSTIAVYDLGGGTFDTAILRKAGAGRFEFLGRPEGIEGLGGADFDAAVLRHVAEHTGEGFAALDPADPAVLAALARLRRECVEAKEALSADSEASISVFLPGVHQQVRLVRSELEALIEEPLRETVDALERSLDDLGLEPDDLTAVLLIGGSSRIPFVAQLVSERLDRPIAVDADPKSSICLGAAAAAVAAAAVASTEVAAGPDAASHALHALTNSQPADAEPTDAEPTNVEPTDAGRSNPEHGGSRRASWSRKSGAAFGSLAGTAAAAAGVGARGHGGAHAPGSKAGPHGPRPTVRLTAVAAAAALFTVLTATAAQSPEGLGSLTAMFAPQEAGSAGDSAAAAAENPEGGAPGGSAGAAAGSAGGTQAPTRGIEAGVSKNPAKPAGVAGIEAVASPTSKPSGSESAPLSAGGGAAGAATGSTTGGSGAAGDPGTTTGDPAGTSTTNPDPATDPVPDPTAEPPAPEPDPTTVPPAPEPDPTTVPPAPEPDPTTAAPEPPAPTEDPILTEPVV
ncbi:MAG TPA: Hsp70 family protein [Arthrobacter sp.]|nr:Hsp70 family protein [Arthrobacter sp.]